MNRKKSGAASKNFHCCFVLFLTSCVYHALPAVPSLIARLLGLSFINFANHPNMLNRKLCFRRKDTYAHILSFCVSSEAIMHYLSLSTIAKLLYLTFATNTLLRNKHFQNLAK